MMYCHKHQINCGSSVCNIVMLLNGSSSYYPSGVLNGWFSRGTWLVQVAWLTGRSEPTHLWEPEESQWLWEADGSLPPYLIPSQDPLHIAFIDGVPCKCWLFLTPNNLSTWTITKNKIPGKKKRVSSKTRIEILALKKKTERHVPANRVPIKTNISFL